jgi:hypothetical protein
MKINPPAGYDQIAPLQKDHRVMLPPAGTAPPSFARLHTLPISFAEFGPAGRDYPLVFVRRGEAAFSAVAALGMQPRQNLFMLSDGAWDRRVYLPAYVRRYPFCMSRLTVDGEERPERVVCVEAGALHEEGEPLYEQGGQPLAHWKTLERLIMDFEADLLRADEMCELLQELDLLEPFTMKAEVDGFTLQLEGMYRVAQERLESSPGAVTRRLFDTGAMERIYAHLLSLDNFRRLLNRRSFFAVKSPTGRREFN